MRVRPAAARRRCCWPWTRAFIHLVVVACPPPPARMNSLANYQKERLQEGTIMQPVGGMQRLRKSVTRKTVDFNSGWLHQKLR